VLKLNILNTIRDKSYTLRSIVIIFRELLYRGADKSLARPGRKQANVSVRIAWISFGALPCKEKTGWQLASRCCWNRARPWRASKFVSFLVGLRFFQHPGTLVKHIYVNIDGLLNTVKFVLKKSTDVIKPVFDSAEMVRKMESNWFYRVYDGSYQENIKFILRYFPLRLC
jgi:hypothetical protein